MREAGENGGLQRGGNSEIASKVVIVMAQYLYGSNDLNGSGKGYDQRSNMAWPRNELVQNWDGTWLHVDEIEEDPREKWNWFPFDDPTPIIDPLPKRHYQHHRSSARHMTLGWIWTKPRPSMAPVENLIVRMWLSPQDNTYSAPANAIEYQRTSNNDDRFNLEIPNYSGNQYLYLESGSENNEETHYIDIGTGINLIDAFPIVHRDTVNDKEIRRSDLLFPKFGGRTMEVRT